MIGLVYGEHVTKNTWGDFDVFILMLVAPNFRVRQFRQREERMLQMRHDVLENSVNNVADKQVGVRVPDGA